MSAAGGALTLKIHAIWGLLERSLTFLRPENIYESVASTVDTVLRFYRLL